MRPLSWPTNTVLTDNLVMLPTLHQPNMVLVSDVCMTLMLVC